MAVLVFFQDPHHPKLLGTQLAELLEELDGVLKPFVPDILLKNRDCELSLSLIT